MGKPLETADTQQPTIANSSTSAARRVTNWTTNLLATGIILIGGLVFGRQILEWWGQPSPQSSLNPVDVRVDADPLSSPMLRFGEMPASLQRSMFEGDREGVFSELRRRCRQAAESTQPSSDRQPGPAEKRLLARVAEQDPVEQEPGKWRLFQLDGPVPLVVSVTDPAEANHGDGLSRVVSWGLGVHLSGTRWALFILASESESSAGESSSAELPVPPGSQRTMSLQSRGPDTLVGFRADGGEDQHIRFYEQWAKQHDWTVSSDWRELRNIWHARYRQPGGNIVDVQIVVQTDGNILGLLSVTSEPEDSREK